MFRAQRLMRLCLLVASLLPVAQISLAADFARQDIVRAAEELGTSAHSDDFSVIVIPEEKRVKLMVERFAEATAVLRAKIAIHHGSKQAVADEVGEGIYASDAAWLSEAGKKALAITIQADGIHDVLVLLFDPAQFGAAPVREQRYQQREEQAQ